MGGSDAEQRGPAGSAPGKEAEEPSAWTPVGAGTRAPVRLYTSDEEPVRSVIAAHRDAVERAASVVQKVARQDKDWGLATCEEVVTDLAGLLKEHRRFLLFASHEAARQVKPGARTDMLALHSVSCAIGMLGCCAHAGLAEDQVALGGLAGMVFDLGMALIPDAILSKPGKLTGEELDKVHEHTLMGARLPQVAARKDLATVVEQSHERLDGSGYPKGLKGDQIHPLACFTHAVDVFAALTERRSYRAEEDAYTAMKIVNMAERGSLWKKAVRALIRFYGVYPIGTPVQLNTGERGKVIDAGHPNVLQPVVLILSDKRGRPTPEPYALQLAADPCTYVERVTHLGDDLRETASRLC